MLSVLLTEDHTIVRNGIKLLLETDKSVKIIGESTNGIEALAFLDSDNKPDIVLADINMPEMDGITLTKEIKTKYPDVKVIILSMLDNEKYISSAFGAGASGYLLKNINAEELIFCLKHVHSGSNYLCAELSIKLLDKSIQNTNFNAKPEHINIDLTLREIEVLHLIAEGMTNNEMSEKLFLSKRTIEGHRQSLIEKTSSKNTAALIRYAVLNGIVH